MILRFLDRFEEVMITFLMAAATLIIFVAVVHRYASGLAIPGLQDFLLKINLAWAQELCIYMFVWMAKIGAAYGVRTGIHVGVDVLINALSPKNRNKLIIFGLLAGALFTGTVGTFATMFVHELYFTEQTSADMELPMWLVYLGMPIGSFLMCFRFLQACYRFIKTGSLPRPDHTKVEGIEAIEILHESPENQTDNASHTGGKP
ncbi:MAG: TRAP transporter small permease [Candidatus Competibacter denitrificans]|jgi:C4-dicarboxylate transporter DctQ subunit|uniref:TRAP transporter small permease protein n=1 Tax=Candidatus Competibacter denitrificans Run_A_D11 TaxID=1400863 RepID=W6M4M1_9GAMM|nr:TRAP transporter small permease [Candidatus Competibacter denitrificans]CDI02826.1 TRAP-type C4-dicarboxylate transporter,permease component [Candidatus Competibacter denitrificans Run_A_D11]